MQVKHAYMWMEFEKLDPRLKQVARMVDAFSILCLGLEIMITEIFRPDEDSEHSRYKGIDLRTHWYTAPQIAQLEAYLFRFRNNDYPNLAVEPHLELKGTKNQHLHLHIRRRDAT